jgi:hypothetical protein
MLRFRRSTVASQRFAATRTHSEHFSLHETHQKRRKKRRSSSRNNRKIENAPRCFFQIRERVAMVKASFSSLFHPRSSTELLVAAVRCALALLFIDKLRPPTLALAMRKCDAGASVGEARTHTESSSGRAGCVRCANNGSRRFFFPPSAELCCTRGFFSSRYTLPRAH